MITSTPVVDPLLRCLLALAKHHGCCSTPDALVAGLPLENHRLIPSLFSRAASRAGLASNIVHKPLTDIHESLLPAVLLLDGEQACLLMGWEENGDAQLLYPELSEAITVVPSESLLAQYSGTAILARPRYQFDDRVAKPKSERKPHGHWFWGALKENLPIYRDVLLAALFINLFALVLPLFTMNVYDRVVPNHALETLWILVAGVAIVLLADVVLRTMRSYFLDIAGRRVDIKLSALIMERVLGIKLEARPISTGSFAANLRSFETVRDFITSASVTAIIDVPFTFIFLLVIGWIAWPVIIPLLVGMLVVILYALSTQGKMRELSETTYRASAMRNSTLIESLVGLDTLKAMGAESYMQRKWEQTASFLARTGVQLRLLSTSNVNTAMWAQQLVTVAVIVTGVYLIIEGELTMGGLIACTMLSSRAMAPLGQVAGLITQYYNASTALESLNEIMDKPLERPEQAKFLSREQFRGDIEFKNVCFSYPGSEIEVLHDISFRIQAGEHVAILGRMGSGKTSMQKLAMGLFQPTSGAVLIDGIDLRQLDPAELRHQVGYVPQDVTLFYGSLRDNLTMAQRHVDDAALVRAVEIASLTEFVNTHPQGFDMAIGERGDSLSGGQRKAVALARAIIHDPPVLLMDEPTGSMDHSSESKVRQQLAEFAQGKTLLVVTHRTSLLDLVDRIIVVDNGKIVADGPRDNVVDALRQGQIGRAL